MAATFCTSVSPSRKRVRGASYRSCTATTRSRNAAVVPSGTTYSTSYPISSVDIRPPSVQPAACRGGGRSRSGRSVVRARESLPAGEQLDLGALADEPIQGVEHLAHVPGVRGDDRGADARAAVQLLVADLGGGHREPSGELRDERAHVRALLLQRVD